ncbi:hypothetical protein BDZ91DRAFT_782895 [Kalaharituber pfeilii]|nr:hypothetical protein BDZ91DRAFT_782895 [Kalaharituber pfeilii]
MQSLSREGVDPSKVAIFGTMRAQKNSHTHSHPPPTEDAVDQEDIKKDHDISQLEGTEIGRVNESMEKVTQPFRPSVPKDQSTLEEHESLSMYLKNPETKGAGPKGAKPTGSSNNPSSIASSPRKSMLMPSDTRNPTDRVPYPPAAFTPPKRDATVQLEQSHHSSPSHEPGQSKSRAELSPPVFPKLILASDARSEEKSGLTQAQSGAARNNQASLHGHPKRLAYPPPTSSPPFKRPRLRTSVCRRRSPVTYPVAPRIANLVRLAAKLESRTPNISRSIDPPTTAPPALRPALQPATPSISKRPQCAVTEPKPPARFSPGSPYGRTSARKLVRGSRAHLPLPLITLVMRLYIPPRYDGRTKDHEDVVYTMNAVVGKGELEDPSNRGVGVPAPVLAEGTVDDLLGELLAEVVPAAVRRPSRSAAALRNAPENSLPNSNEDGINFMEIEDWIAGSADRYSPEMDSADLTPADQFQMGNIPFKQWKVTFNLHLWAHTNYLLRKWVCTPLPSHPITRSCGQFLYCEPGGEYWDLQVLVTRTPDAMYWDYTGTHNKEQVAKMVLEVSRHVIELRSNAAWGGHVGDGGEGLFGVEVEVVVDGVDGGEGGFPTPTWPLETKDSVRKRK